MYVCMDVCTYVCMYLCVNASTSVCMCVYVCTYVCMHVCMCFEWRAQALAKDQIRFTRRRSRILYSRMTTQWDRGRVGEHCHNPPSFCFSPFLHSLTKDLVVRVVDPAGINFYLRGTLAKSAGILAKNYGYDAEGLCIPLVEAASKKRCTVD